MLQLLSLRCHRDNSIIRTSFNNWKWPIVLQSSFLQLVKRKFVHYSGTGFLWWMLTISLQGTHTVSPTKSWPHFAHPVWTPRSSVETSIRSLVRVSLDILLVDQLWVQLQIRCALVLSLLIYTADLHLDGSSARLRYEYYYSSYEVQLLRLIIIVWKMCRTCSCQFLWSFVWR